ncbi:E3 SUMO-protein ligase NSE2 [Harpegnathos saltator]|uniref:E3 SUMO-protein ligase NSE2 n=1 Tax=Harpegnathos saltator TaxID=610380 RepID=E2BIX3_HARSA|nr:E3 SUMO-protein ligase NSE2 [Harpegnathos saltator]EFN84318.1 E3 SUMO-protein ligase NSE2 [Harpegnathos saltator]
MELFMQTIGDLDSNFTKMATNIVKYVDDKKERDKMLKELRDALVENCLMTKKITIANEIKDQLEYSEGIDSSQNIQTIMDTYKKAMSEIQVNPLEDIRLLTFDRQMQGLSQVTQNISANVFDDSSTELRLTCTDINVIDPISKTRMTNPVRNIICGHVYDKDSLVAVLEKNRKTRCPVVGCGNKEYISLSKCLTDIVIKTYLENNPT